MTQKIRINRRKFVLSSLTSGLLVKAGGLLGKAKAYTPSPAKVLSLRKVTF